MFIYPCFLISVKGEPRGEVVVVDPDWKCPKWLCPIAFASENELHHDVRHTPYTGEVHTSVVVESMSGESDLPDDLSLRTSERGETIFALDWSSVIFFPRDREIIPEKQRWCVSESTGESNRNRRVFNQRQIQSSIKRSGALADLISIFISSDVRDYGIFFFFWERS